MVAMVYSQPPKIMVAVITIAIVTRIRIRIIIRIGWNDMVRARAEQSN